jgi:hypothetical protein
LARRTPPVRHGQHFGIAVWAFDEHVRTLAAGSREVDRQRNSRCVLPALHQFILLGIVLAVAALVRGRYWPTRPHGFRVAESPRSLNASTDSQLRHDGVWRDITIRPRLLGKQFRNIQGTWSVAIRRLWEWASTWDSLVTVFRSSRRMVTS